MPTTPLLTIFIYSLWTAIATGFGALPFFFWKNISRSWLGSFNAIAAGFMTAASLLLLDKGWGYGPFRTLIGAGIGLLTILISEWVIDKAGHPTVGDIPKADFKKMLLIVGIMTLHSFSEGVGMGVAFGGGLTFGLLIVLSMAAQNVPEGLAISLVLCSRGVKAWQAALWSVFSSLPQPIMAVLAYLFVQAFKPFLPVGLGFAAGAMLWMVGKELVPEALSEIPVKTFLWVMGLSMVVMFALIRVLGG